MKKGIQSQHHRFLFKIKDGLGRENNLFRMFYFHDPKTQGVM